MWPRQCHCMSNHAHRCESSPLFLACSITDGSSPWCCPIPVSLVPHALSLAFEGTVSLSRPSGNVSRVLVACRLHYLAAAVPTACMHGRYGLCLGPLVTGNGVLSEMTKAPDTSWRLRSHSCSPTPDRSQAPPRTPRQSTEGTRSLVTPNLQALGVFNLAWFPPCRSKTETHTQLQCLSPAQPS